MVAIPSYTGPTEWYTHDGTPLVPITPVQITWDSADGEASRTQMPFKPAYRITMHKSQGLTLDKIVLDLGKSEFSPGLSFVGLSRVRTLDSVVLLPGPPWKRFENLAGSTPAALARRQMAVNDELRRNRLGFDIEKFL
jgi:ATP-dependent DNA helicase PIF1